MDFRIASLILLLLLNCVHSQSKNEIQLNQEFDLKFHETALIPSERLSIQFQSLLQDSRCPTGEQCITQGDASIEIQLSQLDKPEILQLHTDSPPNESTYQEYRVKLTALNPYPRSGVKIDSSAYVATILVRKP